MRSSIVLTFSSGVVPATRSSAAIILRPAELPLA
jgi:hypothetical protein